MKKILPIIVVILLIVLGGIAVLLGRSNKAVSDSKPNSASAVSTSVPSDTESQKNEAETAADETVETQAKDNTDEDVEVVEEDVEEETIIEIGETEKSGGM